MAPPHMPPTPAASTEILAKEHVSSPQDDRAFTLPPSAYTQSRDAVTEGLHSKDAPEHELLHAEASSAPSLPKPKATSRKRTASQAALTPAEVSLPPPPSRSRKIIQMRPGKTDGKDTRKHETEVKATEPAEKNTKGGGGKKKQGTGPRKIARKTAHSLIERRRRSKMNEEFGVLKDMIPACEGQEMHKLAILQASIEYMRYLKDCLAEVSNGNAPTSSVASARNSMRSPSNPETPQVDGHSHDRPVHCSASSATHPASAPGSALLSPAISALKTSPTFQGDTPAKHTYHSNHTHFEPSPSASAWAASAQAYAPHNMSTALPSPHSHSNQASPTLLPQSSHSSAPSEVDQEASAALLMLNASDRRTSSSSRTRGISVKDLLSN